MKQSDGMGTNGQASVAIVGMGCLFPDAQGLREYWRLIRRAEDGIREIPPSHWSIDDYFASDISGLDRTYCRTGGFLSEIDFDPTAFGIPPATLEAIDTSQLLSLMVARAAMDDAGYGGDREFDRSRASVILGVTGTQELVIPLGARLGHPIWRKAMRACGVPADVTESVVERISDAYVSWQENSFPGLLGNVVAGRIANRLDLRGTNCVVDAACASSLSAIHLGMMELNAGRSDLVISGGVDALNDIFMFMCFSKTQALSPTGHARPFSKDADGTVIGEGVGMVVLKRLADARRDGDRIYAVIRGIGTSSDGRSQSIYAPRSEGQAAALRDAYRQSGVDPTTVGLIEAHGTGTKVGDAVEFDALQTVYREAKKEGRWCALGSVKSQIGHTKAAAGVAGLIKAALALHHKVLPPTLKVGEPNPSMEIASSPFYLNTEARPWTAKKGSARRSCVSAFGFGGSNFHMVLEEDEKAPTDAAWDGSSDIFALSARSRKGLIQKTNEWRAFADDSPKRDAMAHRAKVSRDAFRPTDEFRLLLVAEFGTDPAKLFAEAGQMLTAKESEPSWSLANVFFGSKAVDGKAAFLFPGQGSQYVGMGRDLTCVFPEARLAIDEADEAFDGEQRLSERIYPVPEFDPKLRERQTTALTRTEITQPAIGAVSLAMLRVLERFGVRPDVTAGHSYGELVALRAADRIDDDTLRHLSKVRGRLMADGSGDRGTMTAVQAPLDEIERMLVEEKIDVVLAHRNGPTQGILSGRTDAIERASRVCASRGWRTTPLRVAGAFHTELMADAQKRFSRALSDESFTHGTTTVYANCTAEAYPDDAERTRDLLARQLVSPVDFAQEVENLYAAGVRTFVEVGPGAVLTGLVRGILGDRSYEAIALDAACGRRCGVADLARLLARWAASGREVTLSAWEPDCPEPTVPKMAIPLTGANYRAPKKRRPVEQKGERDIGKRNESMNQANRQTVPSSPPQVSEPVPPPVVQGGARNQADGEQMSGVLQVVQEGLRAMQALQQQTAAAHHRFLETQEQAQKTFQMVMESQQRLVEKTLGLPSPDSTVSHHAHASVGMPPVSVVAQTPPVAAPQIEGTSDAPSTEQGIERILIEVVSETTGYPLEAIHLEMDLEEDLGIDRVRRVDLMSQLGRRIGTGRPLNGEQADRLRTLRDIVAYSASGSMPDESTENAAAARDEQEPEAAATVETGDLESTLLDVVAELTGYPLEMLDPDMDLEADLGIDSIKRVEILAAVQSRLPGMAEVNSSYIGSLRTLRNIIEAMTNSEGEAPATDCGAAAKPVCAEAATEICDAPPDGDRLERRVLRAVPLEPVTGPVKIDIAADHEVWIVDDQTALPGALSDKLRALGIRSRVVTPTVEIGDGRVGGLIYLANPETQKGVVWTRAAEEDAKAAFLLTRRVVSMLGDAASSGGALFATVSRMDGVFGLVGGTFDPVQGSLAGLTKTVAHEWPGVRCKAIDVAGTWNDIDAIAGAIIEELGSPGPIEVGRDDTSRRGLEMVVESIGEGKLDLKPGDVVVLSGGARGVTADAAYALATAYQPTLVLLGRSPEAQPEAEWATGLTDEVAIKRALMDHAFGDNEKPTPVELQAAYRAFVANREVMENIARLEQAGSRVLYRSVDIRDRAAVRAVFAGLGGDVGPVRALIHGAGVIEDRLIADKTMEQFERVFDTKVTGLRHLLEAVDSDALQTLVLFSSVSGRFGRQGQVDYAMANEALNKVAQRFRSYRPACRVVAINWGPWDGGMITGSLKRDFERQGIGLIPPAAGARSLVAEMAAGEGDDVEVLIGSSFPDAEPETSAIATTDVRPAGELSMRFERRLDLERHSFLRSHVIDGHPVLPAAIILEWLGHGALHDNPGLLLHGFDDFRVLKGVILSDGPCDLRVVASEARPRGETYEIDVELRSVHQGAEKLHARARAILVSKLPAAPAFWRPERLDIEPLSRSVEDIYGEVLFHGSDFHAIVRVEGVSAEGIAAAVRSAPAPAAWMDDPPRSEWLGDPLVVDAGLQLGIVWCHEKLYALSLPSYGARYRQYRSRFPAEGVSAVLEIRESKPARMTADVTFVDSTSQVLARMEGFEWTVDSSLSAAFGHAAAAVAGS